MYLIYLYIYVFIYLFIYLFTLHLFIFVTFVDLFMYIFFLVYLFLDGTFMSYFGLLAASTQFSHHATGSALFAAFCLRCALQKSRLQR